MKAKLILTALFTFSFILFPCEAQVPQGLNYQAIARDPSNGDPITMTSLQVKLGILSDTIANVMVWEELFNPVMTNKFGMFNLVVGTGVKQSGSAPTFSAIDWTKTPLFLRTSVYYQSSWKTMGTTKLQSVPYSMVAGNLVQPVPLISVKGNTTTMDSALFVVRNNTGQIVFAVYNEGVRIYVDDGLAKGSRKGGFAIGSFDKSKGTSQPLFVVDPDSIRAYLDNNPVKAVKGGFAIGGFDKSKLIGNQQLFMVSVDSVRVYIDDNLSKGSTKGGFAIGSFDKSKGGNVNYFNVAPDSTGKVFPSQNRILWYPLKNALLAGKVIAQNKDSVGVNSFASGYESKSKGKYSQALGYKAVAKGDYSTAIGKEAVADTSSFSFGNLAKALRNSSYAFGSGAYALGNMSFAFGSVGIDSLGNVTGNTKATGDHAYSFGLGSLASGRGAFAIGANDTASLDFATAIGYKTKADNWYALAMGSYSQASGRYATAIGYRNQALADGSIALGRYSTATGPSSFASGYQSSATQSNTTAMGYKSQATASGAVAAGYQNTASQTGSTAFGRQTIAAGQYSMAYGYLSNAAGSYSLAGGYSCDATGNYSFTHGRDALSSGDNSFALGYLVKSTGLSSTATGYNTRASGQYSFAAGYETTSRPYASFVIGHWNDSTGTTNSWVNTEPLFIIGNGLASTSTNNAFVVYKNGNTRIDGNVYPKTDNTNSLGLSGNRWSVVYAATGTINTSDARQKSNITALNYGLKEILQLRPVSFKWKDHPETGINLGLIAQEVQPVIGEVVDVGKDPDKTLGINYSALVPVLIRSIQDQQKIIDEQKLKNQELARQLLDITKRLEKLEKH